MLRTLKTITFVYAPQEDRIAAAINAGRKPVPTFQDQALMPCRLGLAQRAPADLRSEAIAFEREAAIAKTAPAMSQTPPNILKSSAVAAELADRLTIAREQDAGHAMSALAAQLETEGAEKIMLK
jgi:hypothetical protein